MKPTPSQRRRGPRVALLALVLCSLLVPLAFIFDRAPAGYVTTDERRRQEVFVPSVVRVEQSKGGGGAVPVHGFSQEKKISNGSTGVLQQPKQIANHSSGVSAKPKGYLRQVVASRKYDPKSCAWMSGVNVINLDKLRKHKVTENYLLLLKQELAKKCYVVYIGQVPGVCEEWEVCAKQVNTFSGNLYQGYASREVAEEKWRHGRKKWRNFIVIIIALLLPMVGYVLYSHLS